MATDLDDALAKVAQAKADRKPLSIALCGNAAVIYPEILKRGVIPDIVTDQTSAHDLVYGYVPHTRSLEEARALRKDHKDVLMRESQASIIQHVKSHARLPERGCGGV